MSASTSSNPETRAATLLAALRRGETLSPHEVRDLGEAHPGIFFRDIVEPLADSFDAKQATAYDKLMQVWITPQPPVAPRVPERVDTVYVLSRVTLGADIKIVSPILAAMKARFPEARIVFVANRKSAELFAADPRIDHLNADYPRSGPVTARLQFAEDLRSRLNAPNSIVIDPDSRMTQLGLVAVCPPESCFHFQSRVVGGETDSNLSDLIARWLVAKFGLDAQGYIAPVKEPLPPTNPCAAMSLGVGDNETKRVGGDFEARLIAALATRYETLWVDRGVGGGEAQRVTAAVEASGAARKVRFWEGGFAGFASIIAQSALYAGYDSAGQHAAAASGVPLISIFAGAPSTRFRARWTPAGSASITQVVADGMIPDAILARIASTFA